MFHFYQYLPHNILFHRVVQNVVMGLEGPLVGNVFQNNGFTVFRTDRIEIQIGNIRYFLINLSQEIFIYFRKCRTPDKFQDIPASTDPISL